MPNLLYQKHDLQRGFLATPSIACFDEIRKNRKAAATVAQESMAEGESHGIWLFLSISTHAVVIGQAQTRSDKVTFLAVRYKHAAPTELFPWSSFASVQILFCPGIFLLINAPVYCRARRGGQESLTGLAKGREGGARIHIVCGESVNSFEGAVC